MDIKRANGKTWISELNRIFIPWISLAEGEEYLQPELPAYHEYTAFVLEKGLMDPYPTGYFLPDRASTRAEAVEMLWRIAGKPEPDMSAEGFPDVTAGSEHEKAALWAKQAGFYSGEDGQFRGNTALTGNFLDELCQRFLDDAPDGLVSKTEAFLTHAELAQAAQAVWTANEAQKLPEAPFGTASASSPYYAKPCNERLASLPEALMKMAKGGYSWEYEYVSGKPVYALTLMDYANIYSFIHTHDLDEAALREVLSDAGLMVHRKAFSEEEIDLLLGDDQAAAMAHFASPSTIVIGEKGYSEKWMYDHPLRAWRMEGITPEMVTAVQANSYNPLFTQEAADALHVEDGKLSLLPWDYNLAFGTFPSVIGFEHWEDPTRLLNLGIDTPLMGAEEDFRPLWKVIRSHPEYLAAYHEVLNTLISDHLLNGKYEAEIERVSAMLLPWIEKDPTAFCTAGEFQAACGTMKMFLAIRTESIRKQLAGELSTVSGEQKTQAMVDASGLDLRSLGALVVGE